MRTMSLIESLDEEAQERKGYRRTWEVRDVDTDECLAHCHQCGMVEATRMEITRPDGEALELRPNRKLMPSKWLLGPPGAGNPDWELQRASVAKLMNPLGRSILTVRNMATGRELVLTNLTDSKLDLILGPSSLDWYLVDGKKPVAGIDRRKDPEKVKEGKGLLSRIGNFFVSSHHVLVSEEDEHVISGPAFLSMMLLHATLTNAP